MGKVKNNQSTRAASRQGLSRAQISCPEQLAHYRQEIGALKLGSCYQVGGVVRDTLLGKEVSDLDICVTGASAEELGQRLAAAGRVEPLIVAERTVGYRFYPPWGPAEGLELALARSERSSGPGHTDFAIDTGREVDIVADLQRRDFTVNALAQEINPDGSLGPIIDPSSGVADLDNGILRISSPEMISEDPLRILRGLTRLAVDNFTLDPATAEQFREHRAAIQHLSAERVFKELTKIINADNPASALRQARDLDVYQEIFPELAPTVAFDQESKYHDLTVDEHCLRALENASRFSAPETVRWAALLHDSGKPASAWRGSDGRLHYYRNPDDPESRSHEELGAEIAVQTLTRLRAPKELQEKVQLLIAEHMFTEDRSFAQRPAAKNARAARRMIVRLGPENIDDLLLLRRCDLLAKGKNTGLGALPDLERLIASERHRPLALEQLAVNGHDLQELGLSGPALGQALQELRRRVIDQPEHNTRQQLLRWAAGLAQQ